MLHGSRADADALWDEVGAVLAPMGLRVSVEKTKVCHIDEGCGQILAKAKRTTTINSGH